MNDKKIISAIEARDERMLAFVVQKYSKLLWKIAASILINAASAQDVEECVADGEMEERYSRDKLRSCMEGLDEKEKELVIRRYYYEQKPAEIAVALDMPKKKVENRLYYVRQKLRKMMEKQEGERP